MRLTVLLPLLVACESTPPSPTIDGLPPAEDPDLQYIEWVTIPSREDSFAFVLRIAGDSARAPVAFVGASWCGSCSAYKATLETARMQQVHQRVHILEFDLDHHKGLLSSMNIRPAGVPHWEGIAASGHSSGARVDGRAWKTDTLDAMAPVLEQFFETLPPL
jgi:hypothetical protein